MAIDQLLAQLGYTPGNSAPNDSPLAGFTAGMQMMNQGALERQQKEMEYRQKKFDMYKTLRSNGYDSKAAYRAIELQKLGVEEPATEWTPEELKQTKDSVAANKQAAVRANAIRAISQGMFMDPIEKVYKKASTPEEYFSYLSNSGIDPNDPDVLAALQMGNAQFNQGGGGFNLFGGEAMKKAGEVIGKGLDFAGKVANPMGAAASGIGALMDRIKNPGKAAAQKSPYPEYPDAFLENGVWKVERDGTKYRIEETDE